MVKKIVRHGVLVFLFVITACNSESAPDCFQSAGSEVLKSLDLPEFNRIIVGQNINLVIKQGVEQKVEVRSGSNIIDGVTGKVTDGTLTLSQESSCELFKSYGGTTVFITTPHLSEIRSSTSFTIKSEGILTFPSLKILSEDFAEGFKDSYTDVSVDMEVDCKNLLVVANGNSNYTFRGKVEKLNINFAAADARFMGKDLELREVDIFHRGTNDMILRVQEAIRGKIVSTGDVVCYGNPEVIEVEELYKGRLIIKK